MGATKFCPYCGQPVNEGDKFCKNCGAPVQSNMEFNEQDQETDDTLRMNQPQMSSQTMETVQEPQKPSNHNALIIVVIVVCIIIALVIGIFIGRSLGNDTEVAEPEDSEEVEEPAEALNDEEEVPDTEEEQNDDTPDEVAQEEETQSNDGSDIIYGWSVDNDLELTTLEVVTDSDGTTLYMDFTNNTSSSIVIGWASASQANIIDVNGNEYYVHFPVHTEIYASESRSIELQASGTIEAEISKIEIQGVCYIGSSGLPSNIGGSTVTYTVKN